MKQFIFLIFLSPFIVHGQRNKEIATLRVGYGSTNIGFKEAFEPSVNIFGIVFNTGKTFVGDGPEFGLSKEMNRKLFLDLSFSSFYGKDTKVKVNRHEHYYTLEGFQVPMTVNYLLRAETKRLRVNAGAGIAYLKGHLQQYETITMSNRQVTNQVSDIRISELQLAMRPGVQLRILSDLFVSFIVRVGLSTNGRYADNPYFSLKYTFQNKR